MIESSTGSDTELSLSRYMLATIDYAQYRRIAHWNDLFAHPNIIYICRIELYQFAPYGEI
jgi:hypothetical protein